MRVLLLTQWFPPEPQRLLLEIALSLRDAGHEVTVLTGFPNFPAGKLYPGYRLRFFQREQIEGVPVIRVPLYPDHSRSAIKRALNIASFAFSAAILGPWLIPRVDVIHVIHPPPTVALPAWILSRVKGVPFTYEIQDMWPETLRSTGMVHSERVLGWIGRFAKWAYSRAAAIRVISPGFRDNLVAKGVPAEKIHVISNWVDTDFYRPLDPDPQLAKQLGLAGRFNIMFAGMMGPAQNLETVVEAASLLDDLPDVQFVLVGDGNDVPRLRQLVERRGLANVKFLGRFPSEEMSGLYALADVLLIHLRDDPLFRITIPHKTFEYMASEKPILAAVEGDVAAVVQAAGAGLTCPQGNPKALAETVRRFHAMPAAGRQAMAANGRRVACECYARGAVTNQIVEMLQAVAIGAEHVRLSGMHVNEKNRSDMTCLFYVAESSANSGSPRAIDSCYTYSLWRPGFLRLVPRGFPLLPFGAWWLLHRLHVFANRNYGLFLVYCGGKLVHRTCVFPGYFRFPFMGKNDLQIGDTWTSEEHRGRGIAPFAVQKVLEWEARPGRRFWYITTETNVASIRAVEKAGFTLAGKGRRSSRFGLRALGSYVMES